MTRGRFACGALATFAVLLLGAGLLAAPASGDPSIAGWSAPRLIDAQAGFPQDVDCVSPTFCMATDAYGSVMQYGGRAWTYPRHVLPFQQFDSLISCASTEFCVALAGTGVVRRDVRGVWQPLQRIDAPDMALDDVSCPTSTFCMAVDEFGYTFRWNGRAWAKSPPRIDVDVGNVSCSSARFCVATGFDGEAAIYNGTAWSTPQIVDPGSEMSGGIRAVSCVSAVFCVAVDNRGEGTIFRGHSWSPPRRFEPVGHGALTSISCPSDHFCLAVSQHGWMNVYNGHVWRSAGRVASEADSSGSASCVNAVTCRVVYSDGSYWFFNGTKASGRHDLDPNSGPQQISCVSSSMCVEVDDIGRFTKGAGDRWSRLAAFDPAARGSRDVTSVTCASATFCAAFGSYLMFTYDGAHWSASGRVPGRYPVDEASCPSSTFCAVAVQQGVQTYDDGEWSRQHLFDHRSTLEHLSCTSRWLCIGVDALGRYTRYDGTTWSALAPTGVHGLTDVSCVSSTFCIAVDRAGDALRYTGTRWIIAHRCAAGRTVPGLVRLLDLLSRERTKWVRGSAAQFQLVVQGADHCAQHPVDLMLVGRVLRRGRLLGLRGDLSRVTDLA